MIIWKGKGILIFLCFIVTVVVLAIVNGLLKEYLGLSNTVPIEVFLGIVLIVTGIWSRLTTEDYYIGKEGRKKYLDIENNLFFIKMKIWELILPSLGVGLIIYGVVK
jgi:flagellar biosynthesis protein FliP